MLPEADLPIVSRELVYTALTRARGAPCMSWETRGPWATEGRGRQR
jgi:hypothetical protein